jgi:ArsR family transcriptional regulator
MSYHLRVLREAGLVESTRRGRWVDYRLIDNVDRMLIGALPAGLTQVESE